jgi:hypothetical protein
MAALGGVKTKKHSSGGIQHEYNHIGGTMYLWLTISWEYVKVIVGSKPRSDRL